MPAVLKLAAGDSRRAEFPAFAAGLLRWPLPNVLLLPPGKSKKELTARNNSDVQDQNTPIKTQTGGFKVELF